MTHVVVWVDHKEAISVALSHDQTSFDIDTVEPRRLQIMVVAPAV